MSIYIEFSKVGINIPRIDVILIFTISHLVASKIIKRTFFSVRLLCIISTAAIQSEEFICNDILE